jgi:hypothetical protein
VYAFSFFELPRHILGLVSTLGAVSTLLRTPSTSTSRHFQLLKLILVHPLSCHRPHGIHHADCLAQTADMEVQQRCRRCRSEIQTALACIWMRPATELRGSPSRGLIKTQRPSKLSMGPPRPTDNCFDAEGHNCPRDQKIAGLTSALGSSIARPQFAMRSFLIRTMNGHLHNRESDSTCPGPMPS